MIDIANLTASKPGKGTFTKLVARLREQYPELGIFVESVLNPRFRVKLIKMGFTQQEHDSYNYYLLPEK